jgi:hypothetical protein
MRRFCARANITQAMGTVGDSYDNPMAESLWSSLKPELVDDAHFNTKELARRAICDWIIWYNNQRVSQFLRICLTGTVRGSLEHQSKPHKATALSSGGTPECYPTGTKVSDDELSAVPREAHRFHGEWNYTCNGTRLKSRPRKRTTTK